MPIFFAWGLSWLPDTCFCLPHPAQVDICLAGEFSWPADDVGGARGYVDFVQAIWDPKHPEHAEMLEWTGGSFDPELFDLEAVNQRLHHL